MSDGPLYFAEVDGQHPEYARPQDKKDNSRGGGAHENARKPA